MPRRLGPLLFLLSCTQLDASKLEFFAPDHSGGCPTGFELCDGTCWRSAPASCHAPKPDAGADAGSPDAGRCGTRCTTNPKTPCVQGVVACAGGFESCVDGADELDGTPCRVGGVCTRGTCVNCGDDMSCATNPGAPCRAGKLKCTPSIVCLDDFAMLAPGAACSDGGVCAPDGGCVACRAGSSCTGNPNKLCRLGVTSCTGGVEQCVDSSNRATGSSCGAANVCDGDGGCVACAGGNPCSGNPTECRVGVIDCATGGAVCLDNTARDAGAPCDGGQTCDGVGNCGACTPGRACALNPNRCVAGITACGASATCVDGPEGVDAGTACGAGKVCNGAGTCIGCDAGDGCSTNPNRCRLGVVSCSTGAPTCTNGGNQGAGTSCGTGLVCDGNGSCIGCDAGDSCTGNPSPCRTGVINCSNGTPACVDYGSATPGTSCGSGAVCGPDAGCNNCTPDAGCFGNPDECHSGVTQCTSGLPVCADGAPKSSGTCHGSYFCTAGGVCSDDACPTGCVDSFGGCQPGDSDSECGRDGQICLPCSILVGGICCQTTRTCGNVAVGCTM